eukprot:TCONS_00042840-protein
MASPTTEKTKVRYDVTKSNKSNENNTISEENQLNDADLTKTNVEGTDRNGSLKERGRDKKKKRKRTPSPSSSSSRNSSSSSSSSSSSDSSEERRKKEKKKKKQKKK